MCKELAAQELALIRTKKRFGGHCSSNLLDYYEYCTKETINGLWLEFGVWLGGTLNILSRLSPVTVYGFDSFEGLPEDWRKAPDANTLPQGTFQLKVIPVFDFPNHIIIQGMFEDTLPTFVKQHPENCAVVHIDSDLYSACKTVLGCLRNRIVPGTIILFDELIGYKLYYEHEMKAWLEEEFEYEYLAWTHGPQTGVIIR